MLNTSSPHIVTVSSSHIEKPESGFTVLFDRERHRNSIGLYEEASKDVQLRVLAQTAQGAIRIAQYHYYSTGSNFRVTGEGNKIGITQIALPEDGQFVYLRHPDGTKYVVSCKVGSVITFHRDGCRGSVQAIVTAFDQSKPNKVQVQYITTPGAKPGRKFWISKSRVSSVSEK
jgi:hypothetical protein